MLYAGNIENFRFHFAVSDFFQGDEAETIIFYGVLQAGGDIMVAYPVSPGSIVVDIHVLTSLLRLKENAKMTMVSLVLIGISVGKLIVIVKLLRQPEGDDRGQHVA